MGTETRYYEELLLDIDNITDLRKQILDHLIDRKNLWAEKIGEIMMRKKYSNSKMARMCGVSHTMVASWKKGAVPRTREAFIKIGFAAGYNISEMNHFLQRYGQYPELYPKIPQDCVYIYVLNSEELDHTYEECERLMESMEQVLAKTAGDRTHAAGIRRQTRDAWKELMRQESAEALEQYIRKCNADSDVNFGRFYDLVREAVAENNKAANALYGEDTEEESIHYFAMMQEMSSSLVHIIYEIFQEKWFPRRDKVIELGIYLNQTREQLDEMLEAAHLQSLYVRNPMECALIYGMVDAELNGRIQSGTNDLYLHVTNVLEEIDHEISL